MRRQARCGNFAPQDELLKTTSMKTTTKIKNKVNLFGSMVKWFSNGSKEKEIFWWDIFCRYEVTIGTITGMIIAAIITSIVYLILGEETISQLPNDILKNHHTLGEFLYLTLLAGTAFSLLLAWLMVSPFYEHVGGENGKWQKRLEIGPARVGFANVFSAAGLALLVYVITWLFKESSPIASGDATIIAVIYGILLVLAAINAVSYCNWRFDWAIENQDEIYSRHYKYWTSGTDFASERYQWKYLRWYKMMVAIVLLTGPTILGLTYTLVTR